MVLVVPVCPCLCLCLSVSVVGQTMRNMETADGDVDCGALVRLGLEIGTNLSKVPLLWNISTSSLPVPACVCICDGTNYGNKETANGDVEPKLCWREGPICQRCLSFGIY